MKYMLGHLPIHNHRRQISSNSPFLEFSQHNHFSVYKHTAGHGNQEYWM